MIVDDEEQILDIASDFLKRLGYSVETFHSSEHALSAFASQPDKYNIIITDQTMPHRTGVELCSEIKRLRPECGVILCSGYSASITEQALKRAGVNIFLQKPVMLQKLAGAVRELLDTRTGSVLDGMKQSPLDSNSHLRGKQSEK
jgi:DNA-binding NtrC family response regulator